MKKFWIVLLLVVFYGCATGSSIVLRTVKPAITTDKVKLYLDPPPQYETIGLVEASSVIWSSKQKAQDRAIKKLLSEAARIGANGVVLTDYREKSNSMMGFSDETFFASTIFTKTVRGKAILVLIEQ